MKRVLKCIDCSKPIVLSTYLYGTKRCGSCACKEKLKNPKNHPMYGKHHSEKTKSKISKTKLNDNTRHNNQYCVDCNKNLRHKKREVKRCNSCAKKYQYFTRPETCPNLGKFGKASSGYIHGRGRYPYPVEFNLNLKEQIRKRDKYKCRLCNITKKEELKKTYKQLVVHHIDYNKTNCSSTNLILLCNRCNLSVNSNRDYWYAYFTYLMEETNEYSPI